MLDGRLGPPTRIDEWRSASSSGPTTGSLISAVMRSGWRSLWTSASATPGIERKGEGKNPVYYVLGETKAGRHLFCVVISFPDGRGYPVTARDMTQSEKQRYSRWKKP